MATWQVAFDLLPRDVAFAAVPDPRDLPATLSVSAAELDALLPRGSSWHPELAVWGSEDGDCILLWTEAAGANSLSARLDLREPTPSLLNGLLRLAQMHRFVFYFPDTREVVEPEREAVIAALKSSSAARFVHDPAAFIRSIG